MKEFEVKLTISAKNEDAIYKMLDGMPHADHIWDVEIIDPDAKRFEERIRYDENWCDKGEHFVFEGKYTDEDEWSLDMAFPVIDDNVHYTALTKIRELMWLGTPFHFARGE